MAMIVVAGVRYKARQKGKQNVEIQGKKAVIVGGASGMAKSSAELLFQKGADIAILDLPTSAGAEVAKEINGTFHPVDVMDEANVESALHDAVTALGGLHIAINTAGGGIARRTLSKDGPHPLDEFRCVIELNLVATFNLNRLQAFHMSTNEPEDGERGVIIDTSSIAAFEGQIGQVAYTASKAGIAAMTLTMARDLGSLGIRVLAIAPSLFTTGITDGIPDDLATSLTKDAAFPKRMGLPSEYGRLAVAIVENPMLNGSCIRLDAGQRFGPR
jgi:NAD(P)-dependent dehydrogenase (short-subunit alcohol dehydrogenase family)